MDKQTVLHDEHVNLGARMVSFAGWHMPIQYRGVIEEHECVRQKVGLFDVSHMGEIFVKGPKALESLNFLTCNDVPKLQKGQAQYSLLLNENGGIVDDIIVYCLEPGANYLVCVNAANIEKDFKWMLAHNKGADITNESSSWSQIAIQGPKAVELTKRILNLGEVKPFEFTIVKNWIVARTGYTGEDGFEVFLPNADAVSFWRELLKKGEDLGVQPIGLGARDTLRLEVKYPLYGQELTDATPALEAGLGWVMKSKAEYLGKKALANLKPQKKLVGFRMLEKSIPRSGYKLFSLEKKEIGWVTSGTMSPVLKEGIGVGYVPLEATDFLVQIRDRFYKAQVCKTPFVKTQK